MATKSRETFLNELCSELSSRGLLEKFDCNAEKKLNTLAKLVRTDFFETTVSPITSPILPECCFAQGFGEQERSVDVLLQCKDLILTAFRPLPPKETRHEARFEWCAFVTSKANHGERIPDCHRHCPSGVQGPGCTSYQDRLQCAEQEVERYAYGATSLQKH